MIPDKYRSQIEFLGGDLLSEIEQTGKLMDLAAEEVILRQGQYVNVVPFVLSGLIKVYVADDDKELLLYYIGAKESCIMSFYAVYENSVSRIAAKTEEPTTLIALPADKVTAWISKYPSFTRLLYSQYNLRYEDLLKTINQLIFQRLDERLYQHLEKLILLKEGTAIKTTHQQLADEMGTAREVISRTLKKLEEEKKIQITDNGISIPKF